MSYVKGTKKVKKSSEISSVDRFFSLLYHKSNWVSTILYLMLTTSLKKPKKSNTSEKSTGIRHYPPSNIPQNTSCLKHRGTKHKTAWICYLTRVVGQQNPYAWSQLSKTQLCVFPPPVWHKKISNGWITGWRSLKKKKKFSASPLQFCTTIKWPLLVLGSMHEKKQEQTAWRSAAPAPRWPLHLPQLSSAQELCGSRAGEEDGRPSIIHGWTARQETKGLHTAWWFQSWPSWECSGLLTWAWPAGIYWCLPAHKWAAGRGLL